MADQILRNWKWILILNLVENILCDPFNQKEEDFSFSYTFWMDSTQSAKYGIFWNVYAEHDKRQ